MKKGTSKISYRLYLGFGVIFLLILTFGLFSMKQEEKLSRLTVQLYDHPLAVSKATREIKFHIMTMHRSMKDVVLARDEVELGKAITLVNKNEKAVYDNFKIIHKQFLGDKRDILEAERSFTAWKEIRDEVIHNIKTGGRQKGIAITKGKGFEHVELLNNKINRMTDFADLKAQQFLVNARTLQNESKLRLLLLLFVIALTCIFIAFYFIKNISKPIVQLTGYAAKIARGEKVIPQEITRNDEIGQLTGSFNDIIEANNIIISKTTSIAEGKFDLDFTPRSPGDQLVQSLVIMEQVLWNITKTATAISNGDFSRKLQEQGETDHLSRAINKMTDVLKNNIDEIRKQNWVKTGQNKLNETIRGQLDTSDLCNKIASFLSSYLDIQITVIYLLDKEQNRLLLCGSYAYTKKNSLERYIDPGQGITGQCLFEKKMISLTDVPDDFLNIHSALGSSRPAHIIAVPVIYQQAAIGVMELASLTQMDDTKTDFVLSVVESIAIAINSSLARSKLNHLLAKTQEQAEKLQEQQHELKSSNKELEDKNRDLKEVQANLEKKAKELEISSKYKSEFLANMSHELRTPLNSLLVLTQDLSADKHNNLTKGQLESLDIIYKSGHDLLTLINEILDLSKIEAGKMNVFIDRYPVSDIINSIHRNFDHVIKDKGLTLNITLDPDIPKYILTDSVRLQQIIKNILSNAIKFTDTGGISIHLFNPGTDTIFDNTMLEAESTLAISISDTGIGIPEDKFMDIFEAFQQADGSTSRQYGGTGLGLSITRELVKLLKGSIKLESNIGEGSIFTIYLPHDISAYLDTDPYINRTVPPSEQDVPPPPVSGKKENSDLNGKDLFLNNKTVLIVDNDMRNLFAVSKVLEERGMRVIKAANGEKALDLLYKDADIDIVLIDIIMPDTNGCSTIKKIRGITKYKQLPVIALTAKTMQNERSQCSEAGADDFLPKPIDLESLLSVISMWLYK